MDNFFTGQRKNIEHWMHHPRFSLIVHDVTEPIMLEVDEIYHLACPASPPHYQYNPVKTIKVRIDIIERFVHHDDVPTCISFALVNENLCALS